MSNKFSIRWKLCAYFILFAVFIILLLWLSQIVLFDGIYSFHTKNSIKKLSVTVAENIDNPEFDSLLVSVCQENELSVYIINEDGTIKSAAERSANVRRNKASSDMYKYWYLAAENGGTYIEESENIGVITDEGIILEYDPSHFIGNVPQKNDYRSILYASEVVSSSGEHSLIIFISRVEPLSSTVEVIRIILITMTVIAFVACFSFAFVASKGLAHPIKNLSNSAKQLATGDYNVVFQGGGCLEIFELSGMLNDTTQKLRKTDSLRKEFLANVSHDLRTPLTMIGGYGEMMRDIPGENNSENIQIIIDETKRLTKLVNDTLDLSKLQSGTYNFHPVFFCITEEVSDIVSQFEKLSAGKASLSFEYSENVYISADENLVSEAIYNLVNNAVTHSGENPEVTVKQTVFENRVRISVADNGCGIPEDELEFIWERYQKGIRSGKGTGLGLAIVNTAVKMCGGTCGVKSKIGEGSEFWVEFPICEE